MSSSHPKSPSPTGHKSLAISGELFPGTEVTSLGENAPGSMNDEHVIRGILTDSIRRSGKSREQIVEAMSYLLGVKVTKRALDAYTGEAAEQNRFPLQFSRAFCHATGDFRLIRCVTELANYTVISGEEVKLLELGRQYLTQKRAAKAVADLEAQIAGVSL